MKVANETGLPLDAQMPVLTTLAEAPIRGMKRTLPGLPKTADAMARQKSTLNPCQRPFLSC